MLTEKLGVIVPTNADNGNPIQFVERAFQWARSTPTGVRTRMGENYLEAVDGWWRPAGRPFRLALVGCWSRRQGLAGI
jgi:hypothetical protein